MLLEFDLGNSRAKWRLLGAPPGELASGDFRIGPEGVIGTLALPAQQLPISRIRAGSVAGAQINEALTQLCRQWWNLVPEFAQSQAHCAGVSNGYQFPQRLGVDRWLALLAAYHRPDRQNRPCAVVDCGSAITLDLLQADGKHLGGYIVPGLRMVSEVLSSRTRLIRIDELPLGEISPGRVTDQAIGHGVMRMLHGLLDNLEEYLGSDYRLYFTGGDGERLLRSLKLPGSYHPDLVLDGLAWAVP